MSSKLRLSNTMGEGVILDRDDDDETMIARTRRGEEDGRRREVFFWNWSPHRR